ncbi:hypothetical protein TorRG33x02_213900 [Trema orientale]|uniref:Uncharacterized protein n=1 Tax=Trema orientale TaxID=63057 RepID=A0A2P5EBD2_TREOI|nr:hypothetical protein TorRG33x02_213900 [Trema orientale]
MSIQIRQEGLVRGQDSVDFSALGTPRRKRNGKMDQKLFSTEEQRPELFASVISKGAVLISLSWYSFEVGL